MGLDMYISAEKYIGGWNHGKDKIFDKMCKLIGVTPTNESPSISVDVTVGYWRKANAIHSWFVKNVQDGKDECQKSHVTREQLQELKDDCLKVLNSVETVEGTIKEGKTFYGDGRVEQHTRTGPVVAQTKLAESILPTQSGFFFGGTDYDEYYLQDLKNTVEIIDRCLAMEESWSFNYRASW